MSISPSRIVVFLRRGTSRIQPWCVPSIFTSSSRGRAKKLPGTCLRKLEQYITIYFRYSADQCRGGVCNRAYGYHASAAGGYPQQVQAGKTHRTTVGEIEQRPGRFVCEPPGALFLCAAAQNLEASFVICFQQIQRLYESGRQIAPGSLPRWDPFCILQRP